MAKYIKDTMELIEFITFLRRQESAVRTEEPNSRAAKTISNIRQAAKNAIDCLNSVHTAKAEHLPELRKRFGSALAAMGNEVNDFRMEGSVVAIIEQVIDTTKRVKLTLESRRTLFVGEEMKAIAGLARRVPSSVGTESQHPRIRPGAALHPQKAAPTGPESTPLTPGTSGENVPSARAPISGKRERFKRKGGPLWRYPEQGEIQEALFRAEDLKTGKDALVQIARPTLSGVRRSLFDARHFAAGVLERFPHPNMVEILLCPRTGTRYVATKDYLNWSLAKRIAGKNPSLPGHASALMIARLADALDHAHHHGIIHGDIGLNTIFLEERKEGIHPLLGGFSNKSTQELAGIRTPHAFFAPEQRSQQSPTCTAASDVYALGVAFFVFRYGRKPNTIPPELGPIDEAYFPWLLAGLHQEVCNFIELSMLAEDPAKRATAREVAEKFRMLASSPRLEDSQEIDPGVDSSWLLDDEE